MRRRPPPLTPRQRYAAHLRLGMTSVDALAAVARDIGLTPPNIINLASDGRPKSPPKWTLREIEHVVAIRAMVDRWLLGGERDSRRFSSPPAPPPPPP